MGPMPKLGLNKSERALIEKYVKMSIKADNLLATALKLIKGRFPHSTSLSALCGLRNSQDFINKLEDSNSPLWDSVEEDYLEQGFKKRKDNIRYSKEG